MISSYCMGVGGWSCSKLSCHVVCLLYLLAAEEDSPKLGLSATRQFVSYMICFFGMAWMKLAGSSYRVSEGLRYLLFFVGGEALWSQN